MLPGLCFADLVRLSATSAEQSGKESANQTASGSRVSADSPRFAGSRTKPEGRDGGRGFLVMAYRFYPLLAGAETSAFPGGISHRCR